MVSCGTAGWTVEAVVAADARVPVGTRSARVAFTPSLLVVAAALAESEVMSTASLPAARSGMLLSFDCIDGAKGRDRVPTRS